MGVGAVRGEIGHGLAGGGLALGSDEKEKAMRQAIELMLGAVFVCGGIAYAHRRWRGDSDEQLKDEAAHPFKAMWSVLILLGALAGFVLLLSWLR